MKGKIFSGGNRVPGRIISGGGSGRVQPSKTVAPADTEQVITADEGYTSIAEVVVARIPQTYGHIAYNGVSIRVY